MTIDRIMQLDKIKECTSYKHVFQILLDSIQQKIKIDGTPSLFLQKTKDT